MPLEFTGGTSTPCSAWDNNVTILNDALVDAEIVTNGLITLTKVDGSSFTNNIPYFPDFVVSGLALSVSNILGFPNLVYNPGTYQINAQVYTIGLGSNIILTPGHPTLPRVDIVYVTPSSTVVYLTGTPSLNPVQPAVPAGNLLVAVIGVSINATTVAGYTLTSVNFNNTSVAPATINPGSTYGNTLYRNGSQWIETADFHRVNAGFSKDSYQYETYDATGTTTLASFGTHGSIRGHELEITGPTVFNKIALDETRILIDSIDVITSERVFWDFQPTGYILNAWDNPLDFITSISADPTLLSLVAASITNNSTSNIEIADTSLDIDCNDTGATHNSHTSYTPIQISSTVTGSSGQAASLTLFENKTSLVTTDFTGDEYAQFDVEAASTLLTSEKTSTGEYSSIITTVDTIALSVVGPTFGTSSLSLNPSHLSINTGILFKQRNTAISTTVAANDYILIATAAPLTFTLPATPQDGQAYKIKSNGVATGGNPITINGNGKNIDAAATTTITTAYGSVSLTYNTALNKWLIV